MKKKYLFAEFIIVFLILILPPLFVGPGNGMINIKGYFSWIVIVQALIAFLLDFQSHWIKKSLLKAQNISDTQTVSAQPASKFAALVRSMYWWTIVSGTLMLSNAAVNALALILPDSPEFTAAIGEAPETAAEWALLVPVLLISAYYEEVIYRDFLPQSLITLLPQKKFIRIISEIICILIFAFSHRYLGLTGVLNALAAGIILRLCRIRTENVYTGTAAHFIYNLTVIVFYVLI